MAGIDTLWGEFESLGEPIPPADDDKDQNDDAQSEKDDDQEDDQKDDDNQDDDQKDDQKGDDQDDNRDDDKNDDDDKSDDKSDDDDSESDVFETLNGTLEDEELMFLAEDAEYEKTPEGISKMMADNMEAYKNKLEEDFGKREAAIRQEYENAGKPKFAEMDTENESQATDMLETYYKAMDMEPDEIKEKIQELKDLDTVSKEARIAKRYLAKQEKAADVKAAKAAEDAEIARQKEVDDYISNVKSNIDGMDEFMGFKLNKKTKDGFKDYLFKKDKTGETPAQKASKDMDRRMRIMWLDYMEYNKKDFDIKAKTEISNEMKKKTSRFTDKNSKAKGKKVIDDTPPVEEEGFSEGFLDFWAVGDKK